MILQMKEYGQFLGSRVLGERVRARILDLLHSSSDRVVLDFTGVQGMTQSFADEVFRKLLEEVSEQDVARVAVGHLSDDVRAVLRYATSKGERVK